MAPYREEDLVTIANYMFAHEADLHRQILESEGIPCFVADEHTVGWNPFYSPMLGGVKLKVLEKDKARALELLESVAPEEEEE